MLHFSDFIFFGTKKAAIGFTEILRKCPSCEVSTYADVLVSSVYYHIYYIPIFPIAKEANYICQKCGLQTNNQPFSAKNESTYNKIKSKFKHPWYTYLVIFLFVIAILYRLIFY
jgi:MFS-type transporter involved in bile tolerance (Atg22 family)